MNTISFMTANYVARQLGYNQAVQLLQQTLDEEEQTDKRLSQIAERSINVKAAGS